MFSKILGFYFCLLGKGSACRHFSSVPFLKIAHSSSKLRSALWGEACTGEPGFWKRVPVLYLPLPKRRTL